VTLVSATNIARYRSKCKYFFQGNCVKLQAVVREGFAERLFKAHAHLEGKEGARISREEIGKRVGKMLRSNGPDQSTVASWFNRGIIPAPDLGVVVAEVYGVSAGMAMPQGHLTRVESKRKNSR
jgi:hypothetical protein